MVSAGVVGGTGYTGVELLRILAVHPDIELRAITSRGNAGQRVDALYPSLRGHCELPFAEPDEGVLGELDLVFFATPNGTAMQMAPALLARGVRVIDLAADFRIRDVDLWSRWYGMQHACPELLEEAVYGLPEVHREALRGARLVANPGCYPTAVQLGFLPLLEAARVDPSRLIASAASGASGAGRAANVATLLCEISESLKAYAVDGHRHLPEIEQCLADAAGGAVDLTFTPHLAPMTRGIHATLFAELSADAGDGIESLQRLFESRYAGEPFVDVMPAGSHPETRSVRGANTCRIALHRPQGRGRVVVLSAIDNLVKGAAGQAVQNANLMFGLDERAGLGAPPLVP